MCAKVREKEQKFENVSEKERERERDDQKRALR